MASVGLELDLRILVWDQFRPDILRDRSSGTRMSPGHYYSQRMVQTQAFRITMVGRHYTTRDPTRGKPEGCSAALEVRH